MTGESTGEAVEERPLGIIQMIDALSACILSAKIDPAYRQWAGIQLVRCIAWHKPGQTTCKPQVDLGPDLPPCIVRKLEAHQNRLADCSWNDKKSLLATR